MKTREAPRALIGVSLGVLIALTLSSYPSMSSLFVRSDLGEVVKTPRATGLSAELDKTDETDETDETDKTGHVSALSEAARAELALGQTALVGAEELGSESEIFTFFRGLMGTRFSIQLIGYDRDAARFAARNAFNEVARIEALVSSWRETSEIGRLNARAGQSETSISFETAWLLCASAEITRETRGVFDVTWAALKGLWDFRRAIIPPHRTLLARLHHVGIHHLKLTRATGSQEPCATLSAYRPPPSPWSRFISPPSEIPSEWSQTWSARLTHAENRIDLGGIAKGFGVDQAARVLERLGYRDFLVDGGGDLLVGGRALDQTPWAAALQHPRADRAWGRAWIPSGWSVVTSGDYERYFIAARQRYHHIIDLRTGYPAQGNVAVTVFARSALIADAYATALFVLGPREGLAVAELIPDLEAVFFTPTGEVVTTRGADLFIHQTKRFWRE